MEAEQKALYDRLLKNGRVKDAEAIDKVYNFSKKAKPKKAKEEPTPEVEDEAKA